MTPTEISAHLRLIENQLHELRSRIESAPESAPPLAIRKLSAPVGENYTSAASWRRHIQNLYLALVKEFARREFRVKELRAFLESRVELLPGDKKLRPGHAPNQGLVWHKSVYDAIACRPCTWGDSGALIVYVSRDRWRVLPAVPQPPPPGPAPPHGSAVSPTATTYPPQPRRPHDRLQLLPSP